MNEVRGIVVIVLLAATSVLARPVQSRTADPIEIDRLHGDAIERLNRDR